ncbi:MAG: MATE family efflux transporter [Sphaerochaetaceae bacterium]|nr:MATE family efflux transporter [Candidatus Cloacimonadota bacterium]MDD2232037.1 MATE family efflux transporter [Sphaerochaetaceae bacterium]
MKSVEKGDFSKGSISSNVFRLAFPIILAELVQVAYSIVDRMYIGHIPGCGTEALTGIGLVLPFVTIITAFANLCSYGGATLSAIARGEKDDSKACHIMENAFTLLLISGLVLMILFYFFTSDLLMIMGADQTTAFYACEYFDIYIIGTVFVLISLGMNSFINMQGFSGIGMYTVLIGAVLNIILDPLLIFTLNMGIKGAAVATVISQFFSALWVVAFLAGKKAPIKLRHLRVEKQISFDIMKLGVSGFTFKATNSITQGIVNATLRQFGGVYGTLYIASMSIINSIREVTYQPVSGFVEGAKPVISYNYGAKKYSRVDKSIAFLMKMSLGYIVFIWAILMLFPQLLVRIFTSDPDLIATCIPCIRIYFCMFFMMPLQTSTQNAFTALKHPGYAVFFSLLRKVFLIVPLTIILPRVGFGVLGVFWAEVFSEVIGASASSLCMYFKVWKPIKKLAASEAAA